MSKPLPLINDPKWAERVVNNASQETFEATVRERVAEVEVLRRNLKAVIIAFGSAGISITREMYELADELDIVTNHNGSDYELRLVWRRDRDSVLSDVVGVKPEHTVEPVRPSKIDHTATL